MPQTTEITIGSKLLKRDKIVGLSDEALTVLYVLLTEESEPHQPIMNFEMKTKLSHEGFALGLSELTAKGFVKIKRSTTGMAD